MSTNYRRHSMTVDEASQIIIKPYITEKTFNLIEKENKLTFIVAEKATKNQIAEAMRILYESEADDINTTRTIKGKKAHIKLIATGGARELATKLGLV
jgi:large subunit ribosomal protein L23